MKTFLITSWTLFTIGLILRSLIIPGGSIILILGTLLLIIHSVINLIKKAKTNLPSALLHLSFSFITTYILFRLQYWYCGPSILIFPLLFILVFLLTLISLIIIRSYKLFKIPEALLCVYFVFFIILSFTHSHKIFYILNLNNLIHSESRKIDYYSWDRYSWFLYVSCKYEEAIDANENAKKAVKICIEKYNEELAKKNSELINQHEKNIINQNWTSYP